MDRGFGATVDDLIAAQYGVISRRQLINAGIGLGVINHRMRTGALVPVDRGVYRARMAPPSVEQSLMAAVLGIGGAAVVSHQSAAHLWGLLNRRPEQPHVTTSAGRWRPKPFHVHRSTDLADSHITSVRGIPTTTPARTVVDLGASAPRMAVGAFNQVLRDRLVTLNEFETLLGDIGRQGRAGVGVIRRLVEERAKWVGTNESALEDEFRRIVDKALLPIPVAQYEIRDDWGVLIGRVDFAYPERRLVIELDGYRFHSDPEAFARDRNRQNRLLLAGYRILRYTAIDLRQNPDRVVADLVRSLA